MYIPNTFNLLSIIDPTFYSGLNSFPTLVFDFLTSVLFEIPILDLELGLNLTIVTPVLSSTQEQGFA